MTDEILPLVYSEKGVHLGEIGGEFPLESLRKTAADIQ